MYFTERLQDAFHMIFTSYDKAIAQEGLRKLESIVNTLSATNHSIPAMASVSTTDAIQEDSSTQRELGDAYALLARVYGGLNSHLKS